MAGEKFELEAHGAFIADGRQMAHTLQCAYTGEEWSAIFTNWVITDPGGRRNLKIAHPIRRASKWLMRVR